MTGPIQLVAYMTSRCNLRCEFCRRQRGDIDRKVPDVESLLLEQVFDMFPSITGVSVAGFGEPLLAKNIDETIAYCFKQRKKSGDEHERSRARGARGEHRVAPISPRFSVLSMSLTMSGIRRPPVSMVSRR